MNECISTKRNVFIHDDLTGFEVQVPTISMAARILGCKQTSDIYNYAAGKGERPGFLKKRGISLKSKTVATISYWN